MNQSYKYCIVLGAMKSGTTSVYKFLASHDVFAPSIVKDTKFFVGRESQGHWELGLNWYSTQFAMPGQIRLEASTHYTKYPYYPGVPRRIYESRINSRFIYLYRDPVERAISHYFHNAFHDGESRPIDDALKNTRSKYFMYSNYSLQLSQYLPFFPLSKFLILNLVDSQKDESSMGNMLQELSQFSSFGLVDNTNQKLNHLNQRRIENDDSNIDLSDECSLMQHAVNNGLRLSTRTEMIRSMQSSHSHFTRTFRLGGLDLLKKYAGYL